MSTDSPSLVLSHDDLSSATLSTDLATSLAKQVPSGQPADLVDELESLTEQGARLAAAHKMKGKGTVHVAPGSVVVVSADGSAAVGQALDPELVAQKREAKKAAARAAARTKVLGTVRAAASAVGSAVKAGVAAIAGKSSGPTTSAPSKAPKPPQPPPGMPAVAKPTVPATPPAAAAAKKAATTPTTPPPAKR